MHTHKIQSSMFIVVDLRIVGRGNGIGNYGSITSGQHPQNWQFICHNSQLL